MINSTIHSLAGNPARGRDRIHRVRPTPSDSVDGIHTLTLSPDMPVRAPDRCRVAPPGQMGSGGRDECGTNVHPGFSQRNQGGTADAMNAVPTRGFMRALILCILQVIGYSREAEFPQI
jgi:hypothetical protein